MNVTLSRRQKGIWIGLVSLIMLSNYLLYALPIVPAAPKEVVLGSLLDCMFVIPIITYFFIIRKRYSLTYIVPVVIAGYIFARFIIPSDYLQDFSYVSYIIIAGEIAFVCLELFLLYKIVRKLPTIIKKYKEYKSEYSSFSYAIDAAFDATMKRNKLIDIIVTECKLIYYAFLSWREKVPEGEYVYSYHKKTGAIGVYIMIIHATLIESIGFHYLLHQWNPVIAWILLILNVYAMIYFIAEIQAMRKNPLNVTEEQVIIQIGLGKKIVIPFTQIDNIAFYKGDELLTAKEGKQVLDATVMEFIKEPATFEITLKEPVKAQLLYGFSKTVSRVHLNVDEERKFYDAVKEKLKHE
ncbi:MULTISPECIES: hypothetical protein [Bacillus]|uniref:Beta-carotene 15,15'-monooxygenase n=3 Tax=Bacillus thuringiensis TaxID=1428 RepID=A0AAP4QBN9_BACTU|nr:MULTISPECIES: hypothetical protein [Bacillus]MEC2880039.1 hypothetical protein [Bacillus cereus]AEA16589.1 hypothetical protein CT43_CH2915 [Bacillus thuringiensis serovar chinensis CT-43]AFV18726.1 hypothetical protein BTB_c30420 [Bacillus thuringiensis Bt407]AGG01678.1 membrane protein, putative [Bacillus thuringiensis serovar thuringiensis str. IS5056]ARP58283.1 hypothetical protein CAB88_14900 [Bacillus thuringiensis]